MSRIKLSYSKYMSCIACLEAFEGMWLIDFSESVQGSKIFFVHIRKCLLYLQTLAGKV